MSIQGQDMSDVVYSEIDETVGLLNGSKRSNTDSSGTSWLASAFLVVNAALGAGLLEVPWAYNAAGGVLVCIIIQAFLLFFIVGALILLAHCSDIHKTNTYQDVVQSVAGKKGQLACSFCIMIYCFGTCITFFIIIGDQWDRFFTYVYGTDFCHYLLMNRQFTIPATSLIFVLPLCFSKRIDFLTYASYFGVFGVTYVLLLIIVKYFMLGPATDIKTSPDNLMDVFTVVPAICFGYQCHVSVVPIYSCLKHRNVKEFSKTISLAMLLLVLSYTVAAVFGYWTFGADVKPDILESYSPDPEVLVALIMIAGKTYTTYPILLFCGRAGLDCLYLECRGKKTEDDTDRDERQRRIVETVIWFITTLVLAVFIPNIAVVIQLLGGLAAAFVFIFPGICLLKISVTKTADPLTSNIKRWRFFLVTACLFIIIGTFFVGLITTQSIQQDVKGSQTGNGAVCT